jgi:hypothetical protein
MSDYPATKIVHWPTGPVNACNDHAAQLVNLARFMGTHVAVTAAPDGAECINCKNKASKENPK